MTVARYTPIVVQVNTNEEILSTNKERLAERTTPVATCVDMRFAEKLNRRLAELGWNDSRLAAEAKVSTSAVGKWTEGESLPRLDFALRVANALGLSLDYLANDELDAPPKTSEAISDSDRIILDLAKDWGPVQAARRLRIPQDPAVVVDPPDTPPGAR